MSWSWPHFVEYDDGPVTVQTPDFDDRDSAAQWVRDEFDGWDRVDEGSVRLVPCVDLDEERAG